MDLAKVPSDTFRSIGPFSTIVYQGKNALFLLAKNRQKRSLGHLPKMADFWASHSVRIESAGYGSDHVETIEKEH